jgi:AcrR family transcriptional regulator
MRTADTGTERPLRADAARNRERILAAAAEVFAARGLEATLDDIAAHAGLGVGTVYRRFPNRDALVEALLEQRLGAVVAIAESAAAEPDSWTAVCSLLERLCEVIVADRGLHEVFVCRQGGEDSTAVRERMEPLVTALFERAKADGHLRADAVPTDVPLVLHMVAASAEYAGEVRPDLWRRYLALLFDGLRAVRDEGARLPGPALGVADLDRAKAAWHAARR